MSMSQDREQLTWDGRPIGTDYKAAVELARVQYRSAVDTNDADPNELYLSGIADMLCILYGESIDTVLTDLLAESDSCDPDAPCTDETACDAHH